MTYILNLETSTINCSVSLAKDGKAIAEKSINTGGYSHAEKLHVFIKAVLDEAQVKPEDLTAIAVGKGPGSYTGLRIGVSAAKGLCYALDIPLIAIESLHTLALQNQKSYDFIIPVLDARRLEVYTKVYNRQMELIEETHAKIIDENSFAQYFNQGKVLFIGDGAKKCQEILGDEVADFDMSSYPSARPMVDVSYQLYHDKVFEDLAYFEPFYLKDFIVGKPKKS